jgi:hypothetical protein
VEVQEEVWLYGTSSFIAEVGGYLGLLLGASCYTVYEELIRFFCKKRKKCENNFLNTKMLLRRTTITGQKFVKQ